jgi:hypothetical protein
MQTPDEHNVNNSASEDFPHAAQRNCQPCDDSDVVGAETCQTPKQNSSSGTVLLKNMHDSALEKDRRSSSDSDRTYSRSQAKATLTHVITFDEFFRLLLPKYIRKYHVTNM